MMYTLLLLGLLPLAVLPDFLGSGDDDDPAAAGDTPETANGDILDPIDEDDDVEPGDDPEGVLAPLDEDDESPAMDDPDEVLAPSDEDDQPGPALHAATYEGTAEVADDPIIIDFSDPDSAGFAEIDGFSPGQDVLHIVVDPSSVPDDTELEVTMTEDGEDTEVFVNNLLVAVLKGATGVGDGDVILETGSLPA